VVIVARKSMTIVSACFLKYDEEPEGWSMLPVFPVRLNDYANELEFA